MTRFPSQRRLRPSQRRSRASRIAEGGAVAGLVGLGIVGVIALFVLVFALATAITAVVVWFAVNVCNLYTLWGGEELTFWQVVGVAVGINILRSIFGRNTTVSTS